MNSRLSSAGPPRRIVTCGKRGARDEVVRVWAVVPAKSRHLAKARLAAVLSPDERADLARHLLIGAVGAARACSRLAGVIVVSADPTLRRLADEMGAFAQPDPPSGPLDPLNAAIAAGRQGAVARGADAILVLPTDLPLLSAEVIASAIDQAGDAAVAIAPDWCSTGTNALLLRPPSVIHPAFGANSYARHRAAARVRGVSIATITLPALSRDLDTPGDLALLREYLTVDRGICSG